MSAIPSSFPLSGSLISSAPRSTGGVVVLVAVLGSAVLHAGWNAVAHGIADRLIGFALIGAASCSFGVITVSIVGLPPKGAWSCIIISGILHILYTLLLLASYQLGQFSQAYPLARGTSPWIVALVAVTVLGQSLMPHQLAGVLIISGGLISLVFIGRRSARAPLGALGAAFTTGVLIAAYTVVDGIGVHRCPVLVYAGWLFLIQGPAVLVLAVVRRGRRLPGQLRSGFVAGFTGGLVSIAAYGLVLWAQTRGALTSIAALREVSIVIGALIGALFFGERLGAARALAGGVVVFGIVLLNLP